MTIEKIDDNRILVMLTGSELAGYMLSFEMLDLYEKSTRRMLREVLGSVKDSTGISVDDKKILIEAVKYSDGCMLLLTFSGSCENEHEDRIKKRRIYRIRKNNGCYIYKFDSADSLLSCLTALHQLSYKRRNAIYYRYREAYFLVIQSAVPLCTSVTGTLEEFSCGSSESDIFAALLDEKAERLCKK